MEISPIAVISTEFPEKFGIPRQSGLASALRGRIVFNEGFKDPSALKGLESFSHLWLIWEFSANRHSDWHPTVRPPRLGGNATMGVFATRSPFRPNPVGLSSVKLTSVEKTKEGTVLRVSGADLMDGTPIYDIKPYLPYTDCHMDATGGFSSKTLSYALEVNFPEELKKRLTFKEAEEIESLLSQDPRPAYINEPERIYGFKYKDKEIKFTVSNNIATITEIN